MTQLKITKQSCTDKKADGSPLIGKDGKPFFRVGIQTAEFPGVWINGIVNAKPQWEGTTQDLLILDDEFNGKPIKKFKLPPKAGGLNAADRAMLQQIVDQLAALRSEVGRTNKYIVRLGQKIQGGTEQ